MGISTIVEEAHLRLTNLGIQTYNRTYSIDVISSIPEEIIGDDQLVQAEQLNLDI